MLILLATKPAFLCFVLIGLVTTFKIFNKESINTIDRPLSSTVIWHDSIDYGFITPEPKSRQSLQYYQFWLYILQKIGKFGITRHQVFLKFVLLLPAVEQKRTAILTFLM